jgi:hypothetical protein
MKKFLSCAVLSIVLFYFLRIISPLLLMALLALAFLVKKVSVEVRAD